MNNESLRFWVNISKTTSASTFLLLLIAADCAFVVMHFLMRFTHVIDTPLYSLTKDRGYPEYYQYTKEFWIVILLLSILKKTRVIGYSVWILLFAYLLLDDALQIHETFGGYIATGFGFSPSFGLRAQDFGELSVSAVAGTLFVTALVFPYMRGDAEFRQVTKHLVLGLLALAFFGVFVDMLDIVLPRGGVISALFAVVEDGGEMVVISLIAGYVYLLNVLAGTGGITIRSAN